MMALKRGVRVQTPLRRYARMLGSWQDLEAAELGKVFEERAMRIYKEIQTLVDEIRRLDGEAPDHSTFSRSRHGRLRQSEILRRLFETVVERCHSEGLVGGEGFAVDASLIAADANKQRATPGEAWSVDKLGPDACRAAREHRATLDDAAFGAAGAVAPKFISPSDPAAQWTGAHKGHAFFASAANHLIDTQNAVILDVEANRAVRQAEVGASRTMIDRTAQRFGLKPKQLATDSAYGSAANLAWLVKERRSEPHIPVFDKSSRTDGTFSRSDVVFDPARNRATCPQGKLLAQFRRSFKTPRSGVAKDGTRLYRAGRSDCQACVSKPRCRPNAPHRKVPCDLAEDARDLARSLAGTPAFEKSRHLRKKIAMLFAHLNRILGLVVCVCVGRVARETSFCSPPPLRICESWRSFDRRVE